MTVAMVDLGRQRAALEPGLSEGMARVLAHGGFVNGPEVAQLEAALSVRLDGALAVACANGTDALVLLLRAEGIGPGDAVFVPTVTFAATAEAVGLCSATPVFVDVEPDSGLMSPDSLAAALALVREGPLRPRAVLPVDLFGLPHDQRAIGAIAAAEGLLHFVDCAHSIGTDTPDGPCGTLGDGAATSFYPSKALGCYGDGGAVFTRDAERARRVRRIANHGIAPGDAGHLALGTNSRLDTIQAAVLLSKLSAFDAEIAARRAICDRYNRELANHCGVPFPPEGVAPVWSYYVVRHPRRDALQEHLKARGVASVAYYRAPLPDHPAFAAAPAAPGGLPGTRRYTAELLCLPSHPYMTEDEVGAVIEGIRGFPAAA